MIGTASCRAPLLGTRPSQLTPATYRFFEAVAILPGDFNVMRCWT